MFQDVIIAVSSPRTRGGLRALIRLSGPESWALLRAISDLAPHAVPGWHGNLGMHVSGISFSAAALLFAAPRSYTGQDIAEIHLPNSPALLGLVREALLDAGRRLNLPARPAEPGEFSARAYFNGKMDLTRAEGIAATIAAVERAELRAAASLRRGDLHGAVAGLTQQVADLLARLEAGIDFADEEGIQFIGTRELAAALAALRTRLAAHLEESIYVDQVAAPPAVVCIGKPNVGKSSLINALARKERSITSPVPGTTRDMLQVSAHTAAGEIRLLDVPGEEPAEDELLRQMMAARADALLDADLILEVIEPSDQAPVHGPRELHDFGVPHMTVVNKIDLQPARASCITRGATQAWQFVSALTGYHIAELREAIGRIAHRRHDAATARLALNHRHRALLWEVVHGLAAAERCAPSIGTHPELAAVELRRVLDGLGRITGAVSPDDVLGRIFTRFCIGK